MARPSDSNKGLESIESLVEHDARVMDQLAGELMTALSPLADIEACHKWDGRSPQPRKTLHRPDRS